MITHAKARAAVRQVQEKRDQVARLRKGPITFEFVRAPKRPHAALMGVSDNVARRAAGTVSPQLANDMMLGLEMGRRH